MFKLFRRMLLQRTREKILKKFPGNAGRNALHLAVQFGRDDLVEELVRLGCCADETEIEYTPLLRALIHNRSSTVERLLRFGANPDKISAGRQHYGGQTPLEYIIANYGINGHSKLYSRKMIQLLLRFRANVNLLHKGMAPIHHAIGDPIHYHTESQKISTEIISILKDGPMHIDMNIRDTEGWSPIEMAASWIRPYSTELIRLFFENGALFPDHTATLSKVCYDELMETWIEMEHEQLHQIGMSLTTKQAFRRL